MIVAASLGAAFWGYRTQEDAIEDLSEDLQDRARDIRVALQNSAIFFGLAFVGCEILAAVITGARFLWMSGVLLVAAGVLGWIWDRRAKKQLLGMDLPETCVDSLTFAHTLYMLAVGAFVFGIASRMFASPRRF